MKVASMPPETISQARTWDRVKTLYLRDGLCHACAAQAAWGHQLGFGYVVNRPWGDSARIKAPCRVCAPIVATFPVARPNGWRSFPRGSSRPSTPETTSQQAVDVLHRSPEGHKVGHVPEHVSGALSAA